MKFILGFCLLALSVSAAIVADRMSLHEMEAQHHTRHNARLFAEHRAAQERAAQEHAARERATQELAAQELAARERAARERAAEERAAAMAPQHLTSAIQLLYSSFSRPENLPGWGILKVERPMLAEFDTFEKFMNALPPALSFNTNFCRRIVDVMSRAISAQYMDWYAKGVKDPMLRHPMLLDLLAILERFVVSNLFVQAGTLINQGTSTDIINPLADLIGKLTKRAPPTWDASMAQGYLDYGQKLYVDALAAWSALLTRPYPKMLFADDPSVKPRRNIILE